MFAKFSPQNIVQEFLRDSGMSIETFALLQFEGRPISRYIIDRALAGTRALSEEEGQQLTKLVKACRAFQKSMPCEIAWREDLIKIREILWKEHSAVALAQAQQPQYGRHSADEIG